MDGAENQTSSDEDTLKSLAMSSRMTVLLDNSCICGKMGTVCSSSAR